MYPEDDLIQFFIFLLDAVIISVVFNRNRVGQFIVSQEDAIAVIDLAAGSLDFLGLLDLKLIIVKIILPFYNL